MPSCFDWALIAVVVLVDGAGLPPLIALPCATSPWGFLPEYYLVFGRCPSQLSLPACGERQIRVHYGGGVPGGMGRLVGSSGAHLNGVSCANKEDGVLELALACVRPPSLKEG